MNDVFEKQKLTKQTARILLKARGYEMRCFFDHIHAIDAKNREFHLCMEEKLQTMSTEEFLLCLEDALAVMKSLEVGGQKISILQRLLQFTGKIKMQREM